jgi:hypothetical protein
MKFTGCVLLGLNSTENEDGGRGRVEKEADLQVVGPFQVHAEQLFFVIEVQRSERL